jgi:hypothetical protein
MAESKNNVLTHGLSGKVGDLIVFRSRFGKTIVASKPKERTGEPTEAQQAVQSKFQEAVLYAKGAIKNPETATGYQQESEKSGKEGKTAYNIAVADFFQAPDIKTVDLEKYSGKAGDTITIEVTDDFKVKSVTVAILNADGTEVEHADAKQDANDTRKWVFTAKAANASLDGDKIIIRASDIPGNVTEKETSLS